MAKCKNPAFYRFTWPGKDESFICTEHVNKLSAVASAIGLHLQILPLHAGDEHGCNQEIDDKKKEESE